MTKYEINLLLYLETCAVDKSGVIDQAHLNDSDRTLLKEWGKNGYVGSGRIAAPKFGTWIRLSVVAWQTAHRERQSRAHRSFSKRTWLTTEEKRHA